MSEMTTNASGTSKEPSTVSYQSVAALEKINVSHEIVVCEFADWRKNVDFFGQIRGTFDVPVPDTKKKRNYKARLLK